VGPLTFPSGSAEIVALVDRAAGTIPEPKVHITSGVSLFGVSRSMTLGISRDSVMMTSNQDLGALLKLKFSAATDLSGIHQFSDLAGAEFRVTSSIASNPGQFLKDIGETKVREEFDRLAPSIAAATDAVAVAQDRVDDLTEQIADMEAQAEADKQAAMGALTDAEATVNGLQFQINTLNAEISDLESQYEFCNQTTMQCVLWRPTRTGCIVDSPLGCVIPEMSIVCAEELPLPDFPAIGRCIERNASVSFQLTGKQAELRSTQGVWALASNTLHQLRRGIQVIPVYLDPRVLALKGARISATQLLTTAQMTLDELVGGVDLLQAGLDELANFADPTFFALEESSIEGRLSLGIAGEPMILDMNFRVKGNLYSQRVAFSLTDPAYNIEQLSLIPLGVAVEKVVEEGHRLVVIPHHLLDVVESLYEDRKADIESRVADAVAANAGFFGPAGTAADPGAAIAQDRLNRAAQQDSLIAAAIAALDALLIANGQERDAFCTTGSLDSRLTKPVFDPCYYVTQNPDVRDLVGDDFVAAGQHWIDYGLSEGRQGSADFSAVSYILRHSDLETIFFLGDSYDYVAAVDHWIANGQSEGRDGGRLECSGETGSLGLEEAILDPCFYLNNNTDLQFAFYNDLAAATNHWFTSGIHEGRPSSAGFSAISYILRYPEVEDAYKVVTPATAGGFVRGGWASIGRFVGPTPEQVSYNFAGAIQDWQTNGQPEGRDPSPFACPDQGGLAEQRAPSLTPVTT